MPTLSLFELNTRNVLFKCKVPKIMFTVLKRDHAQKISQTFKERYLRKYNMLSYTSSTTFPNI